MPQGGARGQNLEHLGIFYFVAFFFLLCIHLYLNNWFFLGLTKFLSVTLDHRVQCPRVGLGVKI